MEPPYDLTEDTVIMPRDVPELHVFEDLMSSIEHGTSKWGTANGESEKSQIARMARAVGRHCIFHSEFLRAKNDVEVAKREIDVFKATREKIDGDPNVENLDIEAKANLEITMVSKQKKNATRLDEALRRELFFEAARNQNLTEVSNITFWN